ncbi:MAG: hypothetical protein HY000_11105 [Planctomycetes bacterium]|nr:hypothetical protein [Planctomycetota bacterium]
MKWHLTILAMLVGLMGFEQAILVARAAVPAQDAVRYVAMAQMIEKEGLLASLPHVPEQPLFPILAWLTHAALATAWPDCSWATAVQLAAAWPLLLCVVPVYATLRRWLGEGAAIAGTLLFCSLGEVARLGADGLSDSTHLLCFCLAIWALSTCGLAKHAAAKGEAGCGRSPLARRGGQESISANDPSISNADGPKSTPDPFAPPSCVALGGAVLLAGIAIGLAVLTRAESLTLLPALALIGIGSTIAGRRTIGEVSNVNREEEPVVPPWPSRITSRSGRRSAFSTALFAVGLLIAWGPYAAVVGAERAMDRLLGRQGPAIGQTLNLSEATCPEPHSSVVVPRTFPDGQPLTFSKKESTVSSRFQGYPAAMVELGRELARTLPYWVGNLALIGLWVRRKSLGPFDCLALSFSLLLITAALLYAVQVGYLSSRHLLLLTPFAAGWAGVGALELGNRLTAWVGRHGWLAADSPRWRFSATAWSVVVLATIAGLPRVLAPLHASRSGHREAAQWLASAAAASGSVLDTRGWTALYTARPTYRFDAAEQALADPRLAWLVVERSEVEFDSQRGRTLRHLTASFGELVQAFRPPGQQRPRDDVLLYRLRSPSALTSDL